MHEVTITGLTRSTKATPNRAGYRILAFFDCEAGGFNLRGCAFVRTPRNGLTVWPPKLTGQNSERCSVQFNPNICARNWSAAPKMPIGRWAAPMANGYRMTMLPTNAGPRTTPQPDAGSRCAKATATNLKG